jgi:hypothetical protein
MKSPVRALLSNTSKTVALMMAGLPLLAQLSVPKVGTARYADGSLHSVQGLPANMIVADLPFGTTQAASFSNGGGLVAQNGVVRLLTNNFSPVAEYPVAETPLLSIDGDLTSALAWLPKAHLLVHWNGSRFDALDLSESDLDGQVTDIQSSGSKQARLLVLRANKSVSAVTVSLRNGNLVSSEPLIGVRGYAFGQSFFVVYASEKELVVDNLRGYRRSVPLPAADFVMERMSDNWLHIYSPSLRQNWALYLTQAELNLSLLPGLPEERIPLPVARKMEREVK